MRLYCILWFQKFHLLFHFFNWILWIVYMLYIFFLKIILKIPIFSLLKEIYLLSFFKCKLNSFLSKLLNFFKIFEVFFMRRCLTYNFKVIRLWCSFLYSIFNFTLSLLNFIFLFLLFFFNLLRKIRILIIFNHHSWLSLNRFFIY